MTSRESPKRNDRRPLREVQAITFDFGNTLVAATSEALDRVVRRTASAVDARSGPFDRALLLTAWTEERTRQFAEEVPAGREVDVEQRIGRVLARLRGMDPPVAGETWDDPAALELSDAAERADAVEAYSAAFVAEVPVPPEIGPLLAVLSTDRTLAILSNWPLASTIDRFVAAAGWDRYLDAIVVSQRVGAIKPDPPIFRATEAALGLDGDSILHVGDDWAADVVGALRAGWRAAYLRDRQAGSPLPSSDRDEAVTADLELDSLAELPAALA